MASERLQSWIKQDPADIQAWLLEGIKIGCDALNLETGIISRIDGDAYVIQQSFSKLGDIFKVGDEFELQNTYCEAVVKRKQPVTYIQVGAVPEMRLHPVYIAVQLESYIGCPLFDVDNKVIGTVNFSSHMIRETEFNEDEIELVNTLAKHISQRISQLV